VTLSSMSHPDGEGQGLPAAGTAPEADGDAASGRHRQHRFPARPHALKVLYGDDEQAKVRRDAEIAGLRPSSYVAAAALAMAEQTLSEQRDAALDEPTGTPPLRAADSRP
jgi:uncharacterized protein (DUF1778 family)